MEKDRGETSASRLSLLRLVRHLTGFSYPVEDAPRRWPEYLQDMELSIKSQDPSKHDDETLQGFVVSVLSGPESEANQGLVQRFLKHAQRCQKEERRRATSAPPYSKARAARICPVEDPSGPVSAVEGDSDVRVTAWDLVHATRGHADYEKAFTLPSHLPGWARTKRRKIRWRNDGQQARNTGEADPESLMRPRLVALDCEMVATADGDSSAVVKVSLVDEQGTVLYQTRVKPRHTIIDYRTDITGLQPSHFEGVTTTRSEARRAVKRCLVESWRQHRVPTILVGHGLSNDLGALRLDYQPCIDTAYIFAFKHLEGHCRPSLRDVHRALLGHDMAARMEGRHDSAEDAFAAMKLVLHEIGRARRTPPLPPPSTRVSKEDLACLLVHGIPSSVSPQQLLSVFEQLVGSNARGSDGPEGLDTAEAQHSGSTAILSKLPEIQGGAIRDAKAVLRFKHAGEANAAFSALSGKTVRDSRGLPAKKISLADKVCATVRKFGGHNGFLFPQHAPGKHSAKRKEAPHPVLPVETRRAKRRTAV